MEDEAPAIGNTDTSSGSSPDENDADGQDGESGKNGAGNGEDYNNADRGKDKNKQNDNEEQDPMDEDYTDEEQDAIDEDSPDEPVGDMRSPSSVNPQPVLFEPGLKKLMSIHREQTNLQNIRAEYEGFPGRKLEAKDLRPILNGTADMSSLVAGHGQQAASQMYHGNGIALQGVHLKTNTDSGNGNYDEMDTCCDADGDTTDDGSSGGKTVVGDADVDMDVDMADDGWSNGKTVVGDEDHSGVEQPTLPQLSLFQAGPQAALPQAGLFQAPKSTPAPVNKVTRPPAGAKSNNIQISDDMEFFNDHR